MSSSLGNLAVKVDFNIADATSNMDMLADRTKLRMGQAGGSVDDFRESMLRASENMQSAALAISSSMGAANDAIVAGSTSSQTAIESIAAAANSVDFTGLEDNAKAAMSAVADTVDEQTQTMGAKIKEHLNAGFLAVLEFGKKVVETALAVQAAYFFSEALGAVVSTLLKVYAVYKLVAETAGFFIGLLTGDSYKSESIDALIASNDKVKELQQSLYLTAQQATATGAAIAAIGGDQKDYSTVFTSAETAIHANTDELNRLGVSYKDAKGNLLPLAETIENAKAKLEEYTEGWDRNKAAAAMGLGTYAQVAAASRITGDAIETARARLNDYNLGIGDESQAAVKRYEDAMRDFSRESDLTSQGFKRAWADQIMPILTDFAEFFKDGFPTAVNAFRNSMAVITSLFYALKTIVYAVAESILGSISAIGQGLEGVAKAGAAVLRGDFSGAKDALVQGWTDAKSRLAAIGDNIVAQAKHNMAAVRQAWAADDRNLPGITKARSGDRSWVDAPKKEKDEADKVDPFDTDMNNLGRTQAGIDFVIANFDKFQGKVKESKAAMAEFDVTMGKYSDEQREQADWTPLTAAQKADYIARNALIDAGLEKERQMGVLRKLGNATDQFVFKEQHAIDYRKQDIDWMGKSTLELSKLTEARRIDGEVAAMINQTNIELGKNGLKISSEQLAAINDRADAAKAAQMKLLDQQDSKAKDPYFNASESIRKYGEDASNTGAQIGTAITNGFKSAEDAVVEFATTGKLSFSSFATSIVADIVRIQARAAIAQSSGGIMSVLGSLAGNFLGGLGSSSDAGSLVGSVASSGDSGAIIDSLARGSFASGGGISGPGTGTSDSILIRASNGEFMMNAESTARNRPLLEYLNNGGIAANAPGFATGGLVGGGASALEGISSAADVSVNLVNQTGTPMQATATRNSTGGIDVIMKAVEGELANRVASGQGALHKALVNNYGVRRTVA